MSEQTKIDKLVTELINEITNDMFHQLIKNDPERPDNYWITEGEGWTLYVSPEFMDVIGRQKSLMDDMEKQHEDIDQ